MHWRLRDHFSIGLTGWPQYARTVRGATLVEKNKEYVQAARVIGVSIRPSCSGTCCPMLGPVLVIATLNIANAIIAEATLSFLGVGMPPTQPSLGTLISEGQNFCSRASGSPCFRDRTDRHGHFRQPGRRPAARCAEPKLR